MGFALLSQERGFAEGRQDSSGGRLWDNELCVPYFGVWLMFADDTQHDLKNAPIIIFISTVGNLS